MKNELVRLQETLYNSRNPTRRWLHRTRKDWIVQKLGRFACEEGKVRVLEVGIGSGIYLPILSGLFDQVVAIDIEDSYIDNAITMTKDLTNVSIIKDDITETGLDEKSFDLVLCSEVIEHIYDSNKALAGMQRLLKNGCPLILSTPQPWSPLELLSRIAFLPGVIDIVREIYKEPILKTGHINLMTEKKLTRQLADNRFRIRERHKSGLYLPLIAEFAGETGLRLEKWVESRIHKKPLEWILWTQYYVAEPESRDLYR